MSLLFNIWKQTTEAAEKQKSALQTKLKNFSFGESKIFIEHYVVWLSTNDKKKSCFKWQVHAIK